MKWVKIALMVAAFAGAASAEDTIWAGTTMGGQIKQKGKPGGYWFSFTDASDNGKASTSFPPGSSTTDVYGPFAQQNGGMFVLSFNIPNSAVNSGYSFVAIGFNWSNPEAAVPQTWSSTCIEYALSGPIPVQYQIKNEFSLIHDNNYLVPLHNSPTLIKKCFSLNDFGQDNTRAGLVDIATAQQQSHGMQIEAVIAVPKPGTVLTDTFKLRSITTLNDGETRLLNASKMTGDLQLLQIGSVVSLSGLQGSAKLEVSDIQGRVVAQRSLVNGEAFALSNLAKGVYFVHVQGGSSRLAQQIALP